MKFFKRGATVIPGATFIPESRVVNLMAERSISKTLGKNIYPAFPGPKNIYPAQLGSGIVVSSWKTQVQGALAEPGGSPSQAQRAKLWKKTLE